MTQTANPLETLTLYSLLMMPTGKVYDFGALEIQAVYISGNVRDPFEHFMKDPKARASMDWSNQPNYPRPDYLSSSRKRLAPQLLFKGGILHGWRKKIAVALNKSFFDTLPKLKRCFKIESRYRMAHLRCNVAADRCSYSAKLPGKVGQTRGSLQQVARFPHTKIAYNYTKRQYVSQTS